MHSSSIFYKSLIGPRLTPLARLKARKARFRMNRHRSTKVVSNEPKRLICAPLKTVADIGLGPRGLPQFVWNTFAAPKRALKDILVRMQDRSEQSQRCRPSELVVDAVTFTPDKDGNKCEETIGQRSMSLPNSSCWGRSSAIATGIALEHLPAFHYSNFTKTVKVPGKPNKIRIVLSPPEIDLSDEDDVEEMSSVNRDSALLVDDKHLHPYSHTVPESEWSPLSLPITACDNVLETSTTASSQLDDSVLDVDWLERALEEWAELSVEVDDNGSDISMVAGDYGERLAFHPTNDLDVWDQADLVDLDVNQPPGIDSYDISVDSTEEDEEAARLADAERALADLTDVDILLAREQAMGWITDGWRYGRGPPTTYG